MNATRTATMPECGTETTGYLGENLLNREGEPARFRPDLRVVYSAKGRVTAPAPAPAPAACAVPVAAAPAGPARPAFTRAAVAPSSTTSPLRLTRRGRIVVGIMVALVVAGLSLAVAGAAQAIGHSASQHTTSSNVARVVVRPGQTLWSVAQNADPNVDPRQVIQQIAQLNALTSETLVAGQQLWVPRG